MRFSHYPEYLSIAIGRDAKNQLKELSEKNRLSIGHLVREAIDKMLDGENQEDGGKDNE